MAHRLEGTLWRHYKNRKVYMVDAVARNPNTQEDIVLYWALHEGPRSQDYWRPVGEFLQKFEMWEGYTGVTENNDGA